MWFQEEKYEKYLKFKNDIKRPLGPFNKELWAIYVFLKFGQILKWSTRTENRVKINSEISCPLPIWKIAKKNYWRKKRLSLAQSLCSFPKKFNRKNVISEAKVWKIIKVQKWHQKATRAFK